MHGSPKFGLDSMAQIWVAWKTHFWAIHVYANRPILGPKHIWKSSMYCIRKVLNVPRKFSSSSLKFLHIRKIHEPGSCRPSLEAVKIVNKNAFSFMQLKYLSRQLWKSSILRGQNNFGWSKGVLKYHFYYELFLFLLLCITSVDWTYCCTSLSSVLV